MKWVKMDVFWDGFRSHRSSRSSKSVSIWSLQIFHHSPIVWIELYSSMRSRLSVSCTIVRVVFLYGRPDRLNIFLNDPGWSGRLERSYGNQALINSVTIMQICYHRCRARSSEASILQCIKDKERLFGLWLDCEHERNRAKFSDCDCTDLSKQKKRTRFSKRWGL